MLKNGSSIKNIALTLDRDLTTTSKEIKRNRKEKEANNKFNCDNTNLCIHRSKCKLNNCDKSKECYDEICSKLKKSPFVCNGCDKYIYCRNIKYLYDARYADNQYKDTLSTTRQGIRISKEEEYEIEQIIYDLIKNKGQSINDVYINHPDEITFSKPTMYHYINMGLFHLCSTDLRRGLIYKPRAKESTKIRKETKIRKNRTYKDYLEFIIIHPKFNIVQMDTVEGRKGGKVFLTLLFKDYNLMLIYLLDSQTTECVNKVFDNLRETLGIKLFKKLFRIILTDNGKEFYDVNYIEKYNGKKLINLFYCDPSASWQKGNLEKNHEYIRYILPKGNTFDYLTQDDVYLISSHINSSPRNKLKNMTPYNVFKKQFGSDILDKLSIKYIKPDDVILNKKLLVDSKDCRKTLEKLITDLIYYYQFKHIKLDNNIKKEIINTYINDLYLYTDESMFHNSKIIIDEYLDNKQ